MPALCFDSAASSRAGSLSLRSIYDNQFRPIAEKQFSCSQLRSYNQAVATFIKFAGDDVVIAKVTDDVLEAFARGSRHRRRLAGLVRQVVLAWNPDAVSKPRHRPKVPDPDSGTARHYFESVYAVEAMVGVKDGSIESTRTTLIALRDFVGYDVKLDEQTDKLAAEFFRWLLHRCGLNEHSVNRYRATWFAVWRHAYDRDLVQRLPRVKRLKGIRNPPDAWSLEEFRRLVDTTVGFLPADTYGDVRCNLWWHAIFLVAYYTGLRRGALLKIRRDDVDLKTGQLYVPGESMKNRQGQMFAIGKDAIDAIDSIWLPKRLLLFPTPIGERTLYRHFEQLLTAAEIPPSRRKGLSKFHKIRRTVATEVAARAGTAAASSLLGHSSEYVTARYIDPSKIPGKDMTKILPPLLVG